MAPPHSGSRPNQRLMLSGCRGHFRRRAFILIVAAPAGSLSATR
jgi:hypothetical protein